jgi:hypothetical protein
MTASVRGPTATTTLTVPPLTKISTHPENGLRPQDPFGGKQTEPCRKYRRQLKIDREQIQVNIRHNYIPK